MTRARTRMVTRGSSGPVTVALRNGSSSSRAVASRMTPRRCTSPSSSRYPRGRTNSNSVRNAISSLLPNEVLALDRYGLGHRVVRRRGQPARRDLADEGVLEVPARDLVHDMAEHHDGSALAVLLARGVADAFLLDLSEPLPDVIR